VSGTASVVGHESVHAGDPARQLEETLVNFDAVIDTALGAHFSGVVPSSVVMESVKLYVRDAQVPQQVQALIPKLRGPHGAPLMCLHGDICRHDLLLEAEAVFRIDAPL
jgi:chorismate lyase/3-hydroxybenzoate synthase